MADLALQHLVAQPRRASAGKPPLLLLLHGVGANEQDLFGFTPYVDERLMVISLRAPRSYQWGGYSWFDINWNAHGFSINTDQAHQSWQTVQTFIDQALETYGVDPERVYLAGFSQGAIISLGATLTQPRKIAGLVVMSGRWMPEIGPEAVVSELHQKPILVTHGEYDQVIPVQYGRAIRDYLQTLPVALSYHEYPMGHEVSLDSLRTTTSWLTRELDQKTQEQADE